MLNINLKKLVNLTKEIQIKKLKKINIYLESLSTKKRILWSFNNLPKRLILSSSFGIQSSVLLHLITSKKPNIPVVFIDTGYLFPETYHFVDILKKEMKLNLKVFRSNKSPAWQEAIYGKLWNKGLSGIKLYNKINKIKPMKYAIKNLSAKSWYAGLRRTQSESRQNLLILSIQQKIFKFLPIVDWSNQKIHKYIKKNNLKYHPLWEKGYVSIGDVHTTSKFKFGMKEEDTRFFGLKRECGLHE